MKELSEKSIKELVEMRKKEKQDLFQNKAKHAIKGLKETHKLSDSRVKIARINTILTHKTSK